MDRASLSAVAALTALVSMTATSAAAKPFSFKSKSQYAAVDFSYSSEAAAIPALVKKLRADLAKERTKSLACGKQESAIRIKMGGQAIACESSTKIKTLGETSRLLSLSRAYWAFTGGAHGNGGTTPLLWDRRSNKPVAFSALFSVPTGYEKILQDPYCKGLNAERAKRRGDNYGASSVPEFVACPKFSELAIVPADSKGRGTFDQIHVIAAPYVAGSYAEGEYDVSLPVNPRLIAALKPQYRASFSAQRQ